MIAFLEGEVAAGRMGRGGGCDFRAAAVSPLDVQHLRDGTPGCQSGIVHFNAAGASLPSQATLDAITEQLLHEARDGPMEAGERGAILMEKARRAAAQLLNAPTSSIAFASSGSTRRALGKSADQA